MTWDEAVAALEAGKRICGAFNDGEYVMLQGDRMVLISPEGNLENWTPANSDAQLTIWDIYQNE